MTEDEIQAWYDAQPTEYYKNGRAKPKKKPVQAKTRTASLFKNMDLASITLEEALQLLSLPRLVGKDPDGQEITAQNGRFGPYLKRGSDSRSLTSEEEIFSITLEEALAIYAQPKQRGRAAAKPALAELGQDPVSEKKILIKDGRFGPYITDGITNITIPRGETVESINFDRAVELLAQKREKGPAQRKKSAAKKPAATKTKKAASQKKTVKTAKTPDDKKPAASKTSG